MDIDYKEVIDFSRLKTVINNSGLMKKFIGDKVGVRGDIIGRIYRNEMFPKTDLLAKIAAVLKVPLSEVVVFKLSADEKKKKWFEEKVLPYSPPSDPEGNVTYEPLRIMVNMYLDYYSDITGKDKTVNDLFDMIEPYRIRNGLVTVPTKENVKQALKARGFDDGYKSERTDRKYKAKGLTPVMRNKLKTDKPLNIRSLYDICNFFGCSIDWVMSYK